MFRVKRLIALPLFLIAPLLVFCGGGCATYEYDLVAPQAHAGHIGSKDWQHFTIEDVDYHLRSSDNRLVIDAYNRSADTMKLIGDDSVAVDPKGESHPLHSRTIPPGSFVRLILPPPPPEIRRSGATFGFGAGFIGSRYPYNWYGYGKYDPYYDPGPTYYAVYDFTDATLWTWEGNGTTVKLILAFDRGKARLRHEFTFKRVQM